MKPRNEPIGEVECPQKLCSETAKVFRFRPRGPAERKTVFSGKLYCECPKHGRIGADGNSTVNEYLLEHANIWEPKKGPGPTAAGSEQKNRTPALAPALGSPEPAPENPGRTARSGSESSGLTKPNAWRPLIDLE